MNIKLPDDGRKVSVDELIGHGLEDVHDGIDLMLAFNTIILALPEKSTKVRVLEIFDDSWDECRGD